MPVDPRLFAGPNIGQLYQEAQLNRERLIASQDERAQRRTLGELLPMAMQGDQKALAGVAAASPSTFVSLQNSQASHADDHREVLSGLARSVRTRPYETRRQMIQGLLPQLRAMGIRDEEISTFDPTDENLDALSGLGAARTQNQPNIQREVEYYRSIGRADLANRLLEQHAEGSPLIANNGDGTFTIIPRGQISGGGQPQGEVTATNPQTGQRLRLNPQTGQWEPTQGGASPSNGSQTFP